MPRTSLNRFNNPWVAPGIALALALTFAATGCGKGDKAESAQDLPASQGMTYQSRAEVKAVPTGGKEIELHHEAIPDFVNIRGEKNGMMAMLMPFAVADGVDVSAIAVGDKVSFTFVVDWKSKPALRVTQIAKLPPDTKLTL